MLNLSLMPAITEPSNYKNSSGLATTRVVRPKDLNPYKPGSPMKPHKISIQPTYNQDRT